MNHLKLSVEGRVSRAAQAASGSRPSSLAPRPTRAAFSLVEVLVVVSLLSLIVIALMNVFGTTQRAFRAGVTQTDVLEGGRAAVTLIAADLRQMAPSGGYSNGAVNLSVEGNYGYRNDYTPLYQKLPGSTEVRTNLLNACFFIGRENTTWTGTGYFVDHSSTKSLYPLYRFSISTNINYNPATLRNAFYNTVSNNLATGIWTNMSHIMDGVVHLVLRAYDNKGAWMNSTYTNTHNVNLFPAWTETQMYFFSNTLPASVELEMGVLEDRTLQRAESLPNNLPSPAPNDRRTIYLTEKSGNVHVFRQRVTIQNVDPAAYQ
jgi:hypothetical protein